MNKTVIASEKGTGQWEKTDLQTDHHQAIKTEAAKY